MKLVVLKQEKTFVAIHKPAGFVTYADSPEQSSISAQAVAERQLKKKLFPVHRIDKDTCGALVFAASPAQAKNLTALFRTRSVKKKYLAIVHGLPEAQGLITKPLERNKSKVTENAETDYVRLATTEVEIDGEKRKYSLVRCEPRTGRYHQLRRHLRAIGCPIIGDKEHGNSWDNERFLRKFGVKRTLLSAVYLAFPDRENERMVRLQAKPDADFLQVAEAFGWTQAVLAAAK
ncbi:MAG: RluA family pseudouridine synthase [Bdellovibrionota bacterium]